MLGLKIEEDKDDDFVTCLICEHLGILDKQIVSLEMRERKRDHFGELFGESAIY